MRMAWGEEICREAAFDLADSADFINQAMPDSVPALSGQIGAASAGRTRG
jgi:hypothetical protein